MWSTAVGHLAAPANSLAALRAELSDELRRRRRTEWLRSWAETRIRPVHTLAGALLVGAAGVVAVILLNPTTSTGRTPNVLGEAGGHAPPVLGGSHSDPQPTPNPNLSPTPGADSSPGSATGVAPTGANGSSLPGGSSAVPSQGPVTGTTTSPVPSATTAPSSAPRPTPSSVPSGTAHPTAPASPTKRPTPTPPPHP